MKTFKNFCAEAYSIDEAWIKSKVPPSVIANQIRLNKEKEANKIGSKEFSNRGGYAALKAGGGEAALKSGSSVSDVLHAGNKALKTKRRQDSWNSMRNIGKAQSPLPTKPAEPAEAKPTKPMDDFSAGGGEAKMRKSGMTRDQVVALGKKNLANQK